MRTFDVVVIGAGPAGSTAATDLARQGRSVLLLERGGRIKPCGGAIPPAAIEEFGIPDHLLVAKVTSARMVSPSGAAVDMPIRGGFVGMVDREHFDEWLRQRAAVAGAVRRAGTFVAIERDEAGVAIVRYRSHGPRDEERSSTATAGSVRDDGTIGVRARAIVGADGAASMVAKQEVRGADRIRYVYAYHEIVRIPGAGPGARSESTAAPTALPTAGPAAAATPVPSTYDPQRCDVYYQGPLSPDFYGWIFPHGDTASIGTGTARRGFSLRGAVTDFRAATGLADVETIRREGAPIPMRPLPRWDNGRDVVLAGDASGVVAPASGEGIYYAMTGGRLAADAVDEFLETADPRALRLARKRFMRAHGRVFWILGIMQRFWYANDRRRERFVSICRDADVQDLTWQAYMHKKLVRAKPLAHARIFFKDLAHLTGLARL